MSRPFFSKGGEDFSAHVKTTTSLSSLLFFKGDFSCHVKTTALLSPVSHLARSYSGPLSSAGSSKRTEKREKDCHRHVKTSKEMSFSLFFSKSGGDWHYVVKTQEEIVFTLFFLQRDSWIDVQTVSRVSRRPFLNLVRTLWFDVKTQEVLSSPLFFWKLMLACRKGAKTVLNVYKLEEDCLSPAHFGETMSSL